VIYICPTADIDKAWPHVASLLRPAIERSLGRDTEAAMKQLIADGLCQLWLIGEVGIMALACVTRVAEYPSGKRVLNIVALGGKGFDRWAEEIETLKRFARENDCGSLEFIGRRGWLKKMTKFGFEELPAIAMEAKL
jgi:hypothetical protein